METVPHNAGPFHITSLLYLVINSLIPFIVKFLQEIAKNWNIEKEHRSHFHNLGYPNVCVVIDQECDVSQPPSRALGVLDSIEKSNYGSNSTAKRKKENLK